LDVIVRTSDHAIEVDDTPVQFWIYAFSFVFVGALFVAGPIALFPDIDGMRLWLRILIATIGSLSVSVGTWLIIGSPRSRILADASQSLVCLDRWGIGRRERLEWPIEAVVAVQLSERRDADGDSVFRLSLVVRDGRTVPMSDVWHRGRERMANAVRELANAANARAVNAGDPIRLDPRQRVTAKARN
jgi:hypothetical protein